MISFIMKAKRKQCGLTLKEIAKKIGVTEATVQRWESGNIKTLRKDRLLQLANILNVSPSQLMGWEIDNEKESFSKRLQFALNIACKTQADLVKETGLNKSTISRYLSGVCEPKQNAVIKLSESLNISEMWLWGYDVPMEKNNIPIGEKLTDEEVLLLDLFKNVPKENRGKALEVLRIFSSSQ